MDARIVGWVLENPAVRDALKRLETQAGDFELAFAEGARPTAEATGASDVLETLDSLEPNTLIARDAATHNVIGLVHPDGRLELI